MSNETGGVYPAELNPNYPCVKDQVDAWIDESPNGTGFSQLSPECVPEFFSARREYAGHGSTDEEKRRLGAEFIYLASAVLQARSKWRRQAFPIDVLKASVKPS
jgi:hypothetical protein